MGTHSPVKGTVETETEAGQETETEIEIESGSETVEVGRGHDQIVPVARRDTTEGDEGVALAEKGDDPGLEAGTVFITLFFLSSLLPALPCQCRLSLRGY